MPSDSRYQLRTGIGAYYGGPTLQAGTGCRINGPLYSNGLSAVYDRFPKRIPDSNYTLYTGGRAMGAIMVVHIPKLSERRLAIAAYQGTKQVDVSVTLHLYHLATQKHAETAEQDLEQLLDAIYAMTDADKTLGGVVIDAGESAYGIQSEMGVPVMKDPPERVEQYASVSFEGHAFFVS